MMEFDQFIVSPRCKQLVLASEDQPQDERDWKKLLRADQEKQYERYKALFEGEKKLEATLRNTLHNTTNNDLHNTKWNEYMKKYRKKAVKCPECGHEFHSIKRV